MLTKYLRVLGDDGAGKKTLIGSLTHKCGLDLPQIELLEKNGIRDFAGIVSFFKKNGMTLSFYGPSANYIVELKEVPDVQIAFWVVDASALDKGRASCRRLVSLLSAGELRPQEQLLILVNKMDLVDWSEQVFAEIVRTFQDISTIAQKISVIPISSLHSNNILEAPEEPSWIKSISASSFEGSGLICGQTLMSQL
ncbi:hypothetical protein F5Y01DRAFT_280554 [Xylaria sp. FL0043]|nr:hypothetical protein F5Y01DRAFT_280554 [Xylaria sp. FL0043]